MRTLRSLLKLNWLDQSQVRTTGAGSGATFTLHALGLLQPSPPGRIAAIRIPSTISQHYFLMEARLGVDPYERSTPGVSAGLPPEGVVVYEIDEAVWAPVHLRAVLSTGQSYTNQAEQLEISATAQVAGGFTVTLRSTEHPDCSAIRHQIAEAEAEIRSLQEELQHAAPGERPRSSIGFGSGELSNGPPSNTAPNSAVVCDSRISDTKSPPMPSPRPVGGQTVWRPGVFGKSGRVEFFPPLLRHHSVVIS